MSCEMSTGSQQAASCSGGNVKETFAAAHLRPANRKLFHLKHEKFSCVLVVSSKQQNILNNGHHSEVTGSTRTLCRPSAGCCASGAASFPLLSYQMEARVTLIGGGLDHPDRFYYSIYKTGGLSVAWNKLHLF